MIHGHHNWSRRQWFIAYTVARITCSNSPNDLLYFTEDGSGTHDIHAHGLDENGTYRYLTIVEGYTSSETVGLTFSPDNKYMYFAHQGIRKFGRSGARMDAPLEMTRIWMLNTTVTEMNCDHNNLV
mgnify:CR=1 FL=1